MKYKAQYMTVGSRLGQLMPSSGPSVSADDYFVKKLLHTYFLHKYD